jgi:tetratricopeptide (TPR) repeat protein
VLLRLRRYKDALGDLGFALEADPKHSGYLLARGQVHAALEHHEAALADYGQAARGEQRAYVARARREAALTLLKLGRHAQACEELRALCAGPSESPRTFLHLGEALCTVGRWEEAAAVYAAAHTRALLRPPGTAADVLARSLEGRGWAELHCGAYGRALDSARAAVAATEEENVQLRGRAVPRLLLRLGAAEVAAGGRSLPGGLEGLVACAAVVEMLALRDRRRAAAAREAEAGGEARAAAP